MDALHLLFSWTDRMRTSDWDANHYLRFSDERTRPSIDLVAPIAIDSPQTIVDLGCGPGNSTQVLRRRWPQADILGIDNSAQMIASARETYPGQRWLEADIATWEPESRVEIVFSNAALQWLNNHEELIPRLFRHVAPGGAFAVQIPSSTYATVRILIHEIADDPQWSDRMESAKNSLTMESPATYYDLLAPDAAHMDVWETEYMHVVPNSDAVVDFISSTGLRPFLDVLTEPEKAEFTQRLRRAVAAAYPERSDGNVLHPFRRTFVIAYKPAP